MLSKTEAQRLARVARFKGIVASIEEAVASAGHLASRDNDNAPSELNEFWVIPLGDGDRIFIAATLINGVIVVGADVRDGEDTVDEQRPAFTYTEPTYDLVLTSVLAYVLTAIHHV